MPAQEMKCRRLFSATLLLFSSYCVHAQLEIEGTIKSSALSGPAPSMVMADTSGTLMIGADPAIFELKDSTGEVRFRWDANQGLYQELAEGDTINESQTVPFGVGNGNARHLKEDQKALNKQETEAFIDRVRTTMLSIQSKIQLQFGGVPPKPDKTDIENFHCFTSNGNKAYSMKKKSDKTHFEVTLDNRGMISKIFTSISIGGDPNEWKLEFKNGKIFYVRNTVYDRDVIDFELEKKFDGDCNAIDGDRRGSNQFSQLINVDNNTSSGHDGSSVFANGPSGARGFFNSTGFSVQSTSGSAKGTVTPNGIIHFGESNSPSTFGQISIDGIKHGAGEGNDHKQIEIRADPANNKYIVCADLHVKGNITADGTIGGGAARSGQTKSMRKMIERISMVGHVITDSNGQAVVDMSDYGINEFSDFEYQLTTIGSFAKAIILKEVSKEQFTIATEEPHVKVSWTVSCLPKSLKDELPQEENRVERKFRSPASPVWD